MLSGQTLSNKKLSEIINIAIILKNKNIATKNKWIEAEG